MTADPSVPPHWRCGNIRRFAQMKTGHTPSRSVTEYWEGADVPWFTLADVWQLRDGKRVYLGETANRISELGLANSAAELLPTGTVVLSRTASVGFSGIMPKPMATSQDFWNWVCGPDLMPQYLNYQFMTMRSVFKALNLGSTHQTIYQKDAAGLQILVPPIDEQRAIADYLDHETGQIDTLIAKQEQLIATLRERRSSLVDQVLLQDDIERVPLRRVADVIDCAHVTATFVDDDRSYPVASIRECQGKVVDLSSCRHTTRDFYDLLRAGGREPRIGDLLFVRNVSVGLVSVVAPGTRDFAVGQETVLLRRTGEINTDYLRYALTTSVVRYEIEGRMIGSTFRRINVPAIRTLPIPLPPPAEQRRAVEHLDEQTSKIDVLIAKAERFIELSKERRTALITAAVTGQIDVRASA